ncbi:hypothetical protein DYB25_009373 [Aphanomyces astaci]|uniref:Uncharacterized protein n=2 Tax=Aphanomyces astaci TaxID=112090 RepID=A0A397A6S0_APHAT|nr:hypothetical protein DYB25_009373 [Aphanomyces astaci]RHY64437.1 hypothetical protein DYB38_005554 [Aphanomyces astaci]
MNLITLFSVSTSTMEGAWRDDHRGAIECLAHLRHIVSKSSIKEPFHASSHLRVNKWDSMILDTEILGLMNHPVKNMFALCRPGLMEKFQPEIDATMLAMLFAFSVGMKQVRLVDFRLPSSQS